MATYRLFQLPQFLDATNTASPTGEGRCVFAGTEGFQFPSMLLIHTPRPSPFGQTWRMGSSPFFLQPLQPPNDANVALPPALNRFWKGWT